MKQADQLILRELQAIRQLYGAGSAGGGSGSLQGVTLALEEQTDGSNWRGLLNAAGSPNEGDPNRIIAWRYPPDRILTSVSLSSNSARLCAFYLPKQKAIHGVKWFQTLAGVGFTPNNTNHVGLYSYVPGETGVTRRAVSNGDPALWSTFAAGTYGWDEFATPYLAPPGIYYAALLYNGTGGTAPQIGSYSILNAGALGGTNTFFTDPLFHLVCNVGTQNALAASYLLSGMTQASLTSYQTWIAVW